MLAREDTHGEHMYLTRAQAIMITCTSVYMQTDRCRRTQTGSCLMGRVRLFGTRQYPQWFECIASDHTCTRRYHDLITHRLKAFFFYIKMTKTPPTDTKRATNLGAWVSMLQWVTAVAWSKYELCALPLFSRKLGANVCNCGAHVVLRTLQHISRTLGLSNTEMHISKHMSYPWSYV